MIGDLLEKISFAGENFSSRIACKVTIEAFAEGYGALSDDMAYRVLIHADAHVINWCARHPEADMSEPAQLMMREAVEMVMKAWRQEREWFKGKLLGCLFTAPK